MLNPYYFSFLKNMGKVYIDSVPEKNLVLQRIGKTKSRWRNINTVNININFTLGENNESFK